MNEPMTITVSSDALAKAHAWIGKRDTLLAQSAIVNVVDNDERLNASGEIQTQISKHIKALEKERKVHTEPLDAVKKEIMAQERELSNNLNAELNRLKGLNNAYATKVAMEAQAEQRRRDDEARRAAMEAAAAQQKAEDIFGPGVEVAVTEAAPPPPAPAEKVQTSANRMVKRWAHQLTDINKVPREFLSLDDAKVRAFVKYQQSQGNDPKIDGLAFTFTMSVESK
jgi:hypothetical protein